MKKGEERPCVYCPRVPMEVIGENKTSRIKEKKRGRKKKMLTCESWEKEGAMWNY